MSTFKLIIREFLITCCTIEGTNTEFKNKSLDITKEIELICPLSNDDDAAIINETWNEYGYSLMQKLNEKWQRIICENGTWKSDDLKSEYYPSAEHSLLQDDTTKDLSKVHIHTVYLNREVTMALN